MMQPIHIINVVFIVINGYLAIVMFNDGKKGLGWLNTFASALNVATVANLLL